MCVCVGREGRGRGGSVEDDLSPGVSDDLWRGVFLLALCATRCCWCWCWWGDCHFSPSPAASAFRGELVQVTLTTLRSSICYSSYHHPSTIQHPHHDWFFSILRFLELLFYFVSLLYFIVFLSCHFILLCFVALSLLFCFFSSSSSSLLFLLDFLFSSISFLPFFFLFHISGDCVVFDLMKLFIFTWLARQQLNFIHNIGKPGLMLSISQSLYDRGFSSLEKFFF